ncbi:hypothetical protein LXL04_032908 [Taraxacum kok-saghyz]
MVADFDSPPVKKTPRGGITAGKTRPRRLWRRQTTPTPFSLKGRNILDDPLIINEVCSWSRKSHKKMFLFKVDFEKAFDCVNWNYLESVICQMNFGPKSISWIRGCLSSSRASVLINGSATKEFSITKGVRQGDPLSPFLFILAMESLNAVMESAGQLSLFSGVQIPNGDSKISHLFNADDALFLGDWTTSNFSNLVRILKCFHATSGLKVNFHKSQVFGLGVADGELECYAQILGCEVGSLSLKYLLLSPPSNVSGDRFGGVTSSVPATVGNPTESPLITKCLLWEENLKVAQMAGGIKLISWILDPSDSFSVASARRWMNRATLFRGGQVTRWNNWVLIKLNILLWCINISILPTRERLSVWGILVDSIMCHVCSVAVETVDHIFGGCSLLLEVWHRIAIWWGVDPPTVGSVCSIWDWSMSLTMRSGQRKAFEAVIITTLWVLWNFRNNTIFRLTPPKKASIFYDVVDRSFFWISNRCKKCHFGWGLWLQNPLIACSNLETFPDMNFCMLHLPTAAEIYFPVAIETMS